MKVAIISDQHFGCRKNSKLFHDYFLNFYNKIFFPTLKQYGITTVIDMGDTFDSRKGIDFSALSWSKSNYYDKLSELNCNVYTIVGNHTSYYRNTNQVNAVDLLLREYSNVKIISDPTEVLLENLRVLFIPWINSENEMKTMKMISSTKAPVVMGHLELQGFRANTTTIMDQGMDSDIFKRFKKVFSGHYHTRSDNGTVFYLGNPYEMFWNDINDTRGFHIFDTETLEHIPVNNPYRLFYHIYYEDTQYQTFDVSEYENKIVKVIVRKKTDAQKFEKFIDKLYSSNIAEIKIVENFNIEEPENFEALESEDTISILNRYVNESEVNLDKSVLRNLIQEVYREACEMV
jgi:DNA repair exonuclease SbcCD nuclease subunit